MHSWTPFSAISFDSDLSKNTLRKSCGMDGMDDETRTDKDDKIGCVSCITGAMNEFKALLPVAMMVSGEPTCWRSSIKHAFITGKKKHPLALTQIYLHTVSSLLGTKEAEIERYNVWPPHAKSHSAHVSGVKINTNVAAVWDPTENLSGVRLRWISSAHHRTLGCVTYMSSQCPPGPHSPPHLDR